MQSPKFVAKIQYGILAVATILYYMAIVYVSIFIRKKEIRINVPFEFNAFFAIFWLLSVIALVASMVSLSKKAYPDLRIFKNYPLISVCNKIAAMIVASLMLFYLDNYYFLCFTVFAFFDFLCLIKMNHILNETENDGIAELVEAHLICVDDDKLQKYLSNKKTLYWQFMGFIVALMGPVQYIVDKNYAFVCLVAGIAVYFLYVLHRHYKTRFGQMYIKRMVADCVIYLLIQLPICLLYFHVVRLPFKPEISALEISFLLLLAIIPFFLRIRYIFTIIEHHKTRQQLAKWKQGRENAAN